MPTGLPNSTVIPAGFEAAHAPVCDATMTATCTATRPASNAGQPTWDAQHGRSIYPEPTEVYAGACRIQQLSGTQQQVGDKQTATHTYLIATPLTAAVLQVNDVVEVTDAVDTEFVGRKFVITDTRGGSTVWQRDYLADEWSPTTR